MKSIKITTDMLLLSAIIGGFRTLTARNCGVADRKIGKQSGLEGDQDGFLGELAFCQLMNVCPDLGLTPRSGSADAVVERDGKKFNFDVKTTRVLTGRLLATKKLNEDVDIYCLAIIDGDEVKFPGYALAEDLCREENLTDLGHGKGYALKQSQLKKWT
jgi:hypothetical protein